eukprot:NODE_85_length_22318_cov_0.288492.p2 type:complete len:698 gc:universal NODE_85_length_22318_cov_0.288492:12104-10011(-)
MSNQLRALTRKQLIQEKRRWKTSLCCVAACPFLMVCIAGGVGQFLQVLIASQLAYEETLVCGSINATDSNGIYLTSGLPVVPKDNVYGATMDVNVTNYFTAAFKFSKSGPPTGGSQSPCVRWHTQNTPDQAPYSFAQVNSSWLASSDTLFIPAPPGGWLNVAKFSNQTFAFKISQLQTYPWWLISGGDKSKFGARNNLTYDIKPADFSSKSPPNSTDLGTGIFQNADQLVYLKINPSGTPSISYLGVPFARKLEDNVDADDAFNQLIMTALDRISKTTDKPDSPTFRSDRTVAERIRIQNAVNDVARDLPWGTFIVNTFVPDSLIDVVLQIGQDTRINDAATYTSMGLRRFMSFAFMTRGALKQLDSEADINHGIRNMPQLINNKIDFNFDSFLADILFPFALSFLFPIFVVTLTREKEDRILIMMKMNGLKATTYYATHAITFLILHILACTVFTVTGIAFKLKFFMNTDPGVYILLFFFWGCVQIAMSFFFAAIFDKSRLSLIASFFTVLISIIISLALDRLSANTGYNTVFFIWPPFAFYRALGLVNGASYDSDLTPYNLSKANPPDNVGLALIALSFESIAYVLMAYYCNSVLPSEYGTQLEWYFPFTFIKGLFVKPLPAVEQTDYMAIDPNSNEDQDVLDERARIDSNKHDPESPLIVKHMRKVYPNGKLAVKDVTFAVDNNSIFGLLGPNG